MVIDWLKKLFSPLVMTALSAGVTALCTAIIAYFTIVYTKTMINYTAATYLLLGAQRQSNETSRNNLAEQRQANETFQKNLLEQRKTNEITQNNFNEQQKPSLYISRIYGVNPDHKKKTYQIDYFIVNDGNSPARITSLRILTVIDDVHRSYRCPPFPPIIFPRRELPNRHFLVEIQYSALKEVSRRVDVFVEINYTDSVNTKYFTREKIVFSNYGKDINTFFYTEEIDPKNAVIPEKCQ